MTDELENRLFVRACADRVLEGVDRFIEAPDLFVEHAFVVAILRGCGLREDPDVGPSIEPVASEKPSSSLVVACAVVARLVLGALEHTKS